ncbi:MAG: hypothetical protein ABJ327_01955 [Litoreibacter sp.]
MRNRRTSPNKVTAEFEDTGLFKNKVGHIIVEVIPQMYRNTRQDLVIRGYTENNREIEVVFAGRRAKQAVQLETFLKAGRMRIVQMASARGMPAPTIDSVRCKLKVEGAWRPRFSQNKSKQQPTSYQLLAARWAILDNKGHSIAFGILPKFSKRPEHT